MLKNILIIALVAAILIPLILTAGSLVLSGSPGYALIPVSVVLLAIFVYVKKFAN